MGRLFNMDNKFFTFMSRVADLCILNVLCIIFCIPVITAGASITAMFYVTMKMVRNEEAYIVKGFFKSSVSFGVTFVKKLNRLFSHVPS